MDNQEVVAVMEGVREYVDREPVQLVRRPSNSRVVVRAFNEGGNSYTDVDLMDLMEWLSRGPIRGLIIDGDPDE